MQVVRVFDPGELWIFSWNGEAARRINAIDADGRSQIFSQYGRSFSFPDLDGDGVREIKGLTGRPEHPEYLYWSWDGDRYRDGPGTPEPRHPNFFPADAAEADVAVHITASDTAYVYHFERAAAIGWIEGDELQRSLEAKLDNARRQLERGNHAAATGILQAFANEVEAQEGKALSDEGCSLLKLNASHLISRLTASSDRGDDR